MADESSSPKTYDIMEETTVLSSAMSGGAAFLKPGLSDIAVVILASSFLERVLRLSMVAAFRKNVASKTMISSVFEGKGPLSTLSAKIDVCVGLGHIADLRHDLKVINSIRNDFAHSPVELHLKDYGVCHTLKAMAPIPVEEGECVERQKFKQACAAIISHICDAVLIIVAKDRFVAANSDGVKREYEAMLESIRSDDAPNE
jgi:DNA-binding MltR family transcriptional regulator